MIRRIFAIVALSCLSLLCYGEDKSVVVRVVRDIEFARAGELALKLDLHVRVPALELLLGAQPTNAYALTRLASPVFHVSPTSPPLLLLHGDQDPQMPVNQSLELFGAYQKAAHRHTPLGICAGLARDGNEEAGNSGALIH